MALPSISTRHLLVDRVQLVSSFRGRPKYPCPSVTRMRRVTQAEAEEGSAGGGQGRPRTPPRPHACPHAEDAGRPRPPVVDRAVVDAGCPRPLEVRRGAVASVQPCGRAYNHAGASGQEAMVPTARWPVYTHADDAAQHLCGVSTPAGRDDDSVWASRRRESRIGSFQVTPNLVRSTM